MSNQTPRAAVRGIRQTIPAGYVIGRHPSAGDGAAQMIPMSALADALRATGRIVTGTTTGIPGAGTVTNVALALPAQFTVTGSPITGSGTITASWASQSQNYVFAGPASGGAGAPVFRQLVAADLPLPTNSSIGGVEAVAQVAHEWVQYIDTSGVPHLARPAVADLSDTFSDGQLLIGDSSTSGLDKATLTAGSGITITNGHGSITLAATAATPTAPQRTVYASGSGTYTTPANALYLVVRAQGAGGGGAGSGTNGTVGNGSAGGNTTFGTALLAANGGAGGAGTAGGAGGSASGGDINIAGAHGHDAVNNIVNSTNFYGTNWKGGDGGASVFGGAGTSPTHGAGIAASTNSGSGGGGGGGDANISNMVMGGGGGAGGYVEKLIASPAASYPYAVGGTGTAGTNGTSGYTGAQGAEGILIIDAYFQ